MSGGGSGDPVQTTQQSSGTTTSQLGPEQRQLLNLAMPGLQNFAASPPQVQGAAGTVAGFNPTQEAGQSQVLSSVPGMQNLLGGAAGTTNDILAGKYLDPNSNPALQGTIDAATRPIWQGLTEQALPAIRSGAATGAGGSPSANYGGSRQGIAEGIASRGAETAAGDTAAKVSTAGYMAGLDQLTRALGMSPTIAASQTMPGATTSAVGDVQQGQAQRALSADNAAFNWNQWLPYLTGSSLLGAIPAVGGGSTTTTGNSTGTAPGPQQNPWMTGIGAGMAGGSILSGLGSLGQGSSGLSALLPFL